jgi:hypothetical protein
MAGRNEPAGRSTYRLLNLLSPSCPWRSLDTLLLTMPDYLLLTLTGQAAPLWLRGRGLHRCDDLRLVQHERERAGIECHAVALWCCGSLSPEERSTMHLSGRCRFATPKEHQPNTTSNYAHSGNRANRRRAVTGNAASSSAARFGNRACRKRAGYSIVQARPTMCQ